MGVRPEKKEDFNKDYKKIQESLNQSEHYEEIEKEMILDTGNLCKYLFFIVRVANE